MATANTAESALAWQPQPEHPAPAQGMWAQPQAPRPASQGTQGADFGLEVRGHSLPTPQHAQPRSAPRGGGGGYAGAYGGGGGGGGAKSVFVNDVLDANTINSAQMLGSAGAVAGGPAPTGAAAPYAPAVQAYQHLGVQNPMALATANGVYQQQQQQQQQQAQRPVPGGGYAQATTPSDSNQGYFDRLRSQQQQQQQHQQQMQQPQQQQFMPPQQQHQQQIQQQAPLMQQAPPQVPFAGMPPSYAQQQETTGAQGRSFQPRGNRDNQQRGDRFPQQSTQQWQQPQGQQQQQGQQSQAPRQGGRRGSDGTGRRGSGDRNRDPRGGRRAPAIVRSPFVERFRAEGQEQWQLADVLGHTVELSKDQEGSRFIQRALDGAPSGATPAEDVQALFDEVLADPLALMRDVFGNYVVQKMLERGTPSQVLQLVESFRNNVIVLTLHTYGCRVVQRAVELFPPEGQQLILSELRHNVPHCVQDQNGNHVIQKCLDRLPREDTGFIIECFLGRVFTFATHAYGCRVIQCIFTDEASWHADVLAEILDRVGDLAVDQFGNYVVQHIIQRCDDATVLRMRAALVPQFYTFACHKFASNVMEKIYARCSDADRTALLQQLMCPASDAATVARLRRDVGEGSASELLGLMTDMFGNYVVQKMLERSDDAQRALVIDHIRPFVPALRRITYGKHIVARLERSGVEITGVAIAGPQGDDGYGPQ